MRINRTSRCFLFTLLAMSILVSPAMAASAGSGGLKVSPGVKAPCFILEDVNGNGQIDLETLDKPAVIIFWSLFCQPCREEMPILKSLAEEYKDKIAILAIAIDHPRMKKAVIGYAQKLELNFPVLIGKVGQNDAGEPVFETADAYGVKETPVLIGVSAEGDIFFTHIGRIEEADLRKIVKKAAGS